MDDVWIRLGSQLLDRVSGPMKFRLVLQPAMAAFFAIRAGLADAKAGKTPYFWGLLSDPAQRFGMVKDGWKSVGRVFLLALVLDAVYQIIVLHFLYPGEMIIVAFILAIVPYLILRGWSRVWLERRKRRPQLQKRPQSEEFLMSVVETPTKDRGTALAEERTDLALQRTVIAAERTLMAWIRTALSMIGFGFSIYKFFQYCQKKLLPVPSGVRRRHSILD